MKPNFALSLSFEGIRLLHRSGAGWTVVGEVPLDEPDLAGALAALRATAVSLEPQGIRTKVLLPADQVKRLDAGAPGEAGARAALEGATPYAVADLVVDHAAQDGRNRVAAVWTGTLEEAEAFAAEHRFHPVSFAAVLPDDEFPGEAFFGESRVARSGADRVERDQSPTVPREVRLALPAPEPEPTEPPAQDPAAVGAALPTETAEPAVVVAPEPPPEPQVAALAVETRDAPTVSEPSATPAASVLAAPEVVAPAPDKTSDAPQPQPGPPDEAPLSEVGVPQPVFASRARPATMAAPVLVGATRVPLRAPSRLSVPRSEPVVASPGRSEPPVTRAAARLPQRGQPLQAPPPPPAAVSPSARSSASPVAGARTEPSPALRVATPLASRASEPTPAADRRSAEHRTPPRAAASAAALDARSRGRPRYLGLILTAALLVAMLAVGVWASSTEQGVAGLFRRTAAPEETVAASPTPEAVTEGETAEAAQASEPPVEPSAAELPEEADASRSLATAPDAGQAAAAAAAVAAALQALPEPQPAAAQRGTPVSPDEADRVYAATGVWLRAPTLPAAPRLGTDSPTVASSADTPRAATDPEPPVQAAADAAPASPGLPPPAGTGAAEATADAVVVLASAPPLVPPNRPGTLAPSEQPVAASPEAVPEDEAAPANAMAQAPAARPALRAASPVLPETMRQAVAQAALAAGSPVPVGTAGPLPGGVATGALGAIQGTPEALTAPPDALAFVESPDAESADPTAGAVVLVAFEGPRPAARPEGLAPEAPPAPEALTSYSGPRPGPRPDGLAPEAAVAEAAEEPTAPETVPDPAVEAALAAAALAAEPPAPAPAPPTPDVQSTLASIMAGAPDPLAGATRSAVASARVPEARPRSFDRVVRDQLARASRAAQPAAAASAAAPRSNSPEDVEAADPEVASAAAAAPSGSTPASVAQVATYADAMALREINLIGVFGQPSDRRALVRMGNGSYLRVGVGDRLDGGQVTAIGDNVLNYTKRGRTLQLVIPGG